MGPSILAAAFTTMCAAIAMLFCTVTFFTKFATILLVTIVMASIASFVVFVVLMEVFGPADPASFINQWFPSQSSTTTQISSIHSDSDKDSVSAFKAGATTKGIEPQAAYPQQPFETKDFKQTIQNFEEAFG